MKTSTKIVMFFGILLVLGIGAMGIIGMMVDDVKQNYANSKYTPTTSEEIRRDVCSKTGNYDRCMSNDIAYSNINAPITGQLTKP